jgi:hypothetical protein
MGNTGGLSIHYSKPMAEPRELESARRQLAAAEADLASAEGHRLLQEALASLDDLMVGGAAPAARTARNLAATYAARIYQRVARAVAQDPQLPEPTLEHYFKVVLAFDQVGDSLPPRAAELKVAVVRALIDRYYEGHPPEEKRRVLEQLSALERPD